jgi:hypothetical protein
MHHLYRLTLAAGLLAAAGPACPDNALGPDPYGAEFGFDQPDTAPWGRWTRGEAETLYAEWDSFSDASHGTDSDRTSAPDVGTFGAVSPWLGWNAGTIRTSTGNLYSFSVPESFEVNFEGEVSAEPRRAVLQIETQGTVLNAAGVTLNGDAPTFSEVTFNDPEFNTNRGPVTLQHQLFYWDLPTAPATYQFVFGSAEHSMSLTQVAVDVGPRYNQAPEAQAGTTQWVRESEEVTLSGSGNDPDGDELTYSWEQISGPAVVLSGADTPSPEFIAPSVTDGTVVLEFRLTVSDGYMPSPLSASDTVRVVVNRNGQALDCSHAEPSRATLWPANRLMRKVKIDGVTGPDPFQLTITSITQDEPVVNRALKDRTRLDAKIITPKATRKKPMTKAYARLRAERQGFRKKGQPFNGNGRVYQVNFSADDGVQSCEGSIQVQVPPVRKGTAVDDGQVHDATVKVER